MNDRNEPMPRNPVPILMYHDLDTSRRGQNYKHSYVLERDFAWQMESLVKAGYHPIHMRDLGAALKEGMSLPENPIVLTFDDGYKSVKSLAHPVLERLKLPYTVFVVTGKIGETSDWVVPEGMTPSPLMSWDDIIELHSSGLADIQPHTVTHRRLSALDGAEISEELEISKADLESRLGAEAHTICYPYGDHSDEVVDRSMAAGYKFGVTTNFGRARQSDNLLRLPRISIHYVPLLSTEYGISTMNYWWKIKSRVDRRA